MLESVARGHGNTHITWYMLKMQTLRRQTLHPAQRDDGHLTKVVMVEKLRSDQVQGLFEGQS